MKLKAFIATIVCILFSFNYIYAESITTNLPEFSDEFKARVLAEIKEELKQELKEELKDEIKEQLRAELEGEIRKQVIAELELEVADMVKAELDSELKSFFNISPDGVVRSYQKANLSRSETKDAAVRRIVREIFDEELDEYVASGGIETDFEVGPGRKRGFSSHSSYQLAKADTPRARRATKEDMDITAGQQSERAESLERTLQTRGSILLPRGTIVAEPSYSWANFSSNRIFIQGFSILPILIIGQVSTETVKRNIFISNLALKYGLLNNLQAEIRVPYRYEHDRVTDTFGAESTREQSGLGDIEVGLSRQIGWEGGWGGWMPDIIAAVNYKSRSGQDPYNAEIGIGTGHHAVRASLIAAKSSDPAVVFGSLSYTRNFERENIENFGTIKPGDTIGYSLGAAIALSYQTAINFAFDHAVTLKLSQNGRNTPGTLVNAATFKAGFNWAFNEKTSLDFSVGFGLTEDAPDVTVSVRMPHVF